MGMSWNSNNKMNTKMPNGPMTQWLNDPIARWLIDSMNQ